MQGFDLDDTLAHVNYQSIFGSTSLIDALNNAKVIYTPKSEFVIITARKGSEEVHKTTTQWVNKTFPNCKRVYFVSGNTEKVIQEKARLIKELNLTDFTDNNREILAGIKKLETGATLWVMTQDGRKPY